MLIAKFSAAAILACMIGMVAAQSDDRAASAPSTFETPNAVEANRFVSADNMLGNLHAVRPLADNDGLNNTYYLDGPDGVTAVVGRLALGERVKEIYALAYLQQVSTSETFAKAFAAAGKAKVESAVGVVKDPIGTIRNVPRGASRFFGRIGEGMKGGKSEGEDGAVANLAGVGKAKMQLAVKIGVSPYSTNEALQQRLTAVARAMAGGGLLVDAATAAVGGPAGTVISAVGVNKTLQDTLVNSSPEDLRMANRKKLLSLQTDRSLVDEFLMHPWFSPWHETIITDALAKIGVNPTPFLQQAVTALTHEDAIYFQRLAQILVRYHSTKVPLKSIRTESGIVCALDRDGTLMIPLSCDYAIWTERASRRTDDLAALAHDKKDEIKSVTLWVDGSISDQFAGELSRRQISVIEMR